MAEQKNKPWYELVLGWAKDVIPTGIAMVMAVYHYMRQQVLRKEAKIEKVELEKKYLENSEEVEKKYADIADSDVVDEAIRDGAELRHNKSDS